MKNRESLAGHLDALDELYDTVCLLVRSALENLGNPVVQSSISSPSTATTSSVSIAYVPLLTRAEYRKKRLSVEIKSEFPC